MSADHLAELLMEEGFGRSSRTIRRYISALREAGFGIELQKDRYVLTEAPLRLPLSGHEALSALSVLESLAERDPAYGEHLA
ncbi:HTH domain-containing protein, partial [Acinetobacter baumannii]